MRFRFPILRNPELQANFEQLEEILTVESYTSVQTVSTKIKTITARIRREGDDNSNAKLEGLLETNAAIPAGTALFTIPEKYRPVEAIWRDTAINASTGAIGVLLITGGVVTFSLELGKEQFLEWGSRSWAVI